MLTRRTRFGVVLLGCVIFLAGCASTPKANTTPNSTGSTTGTWRAVKASDTYPALSPACVNATTCLAIDNGAIVRTVNGGSSWTTSLRVDPSSVDLSIISCNGNECVAVGDGYGTSPPTAYATSDGGGNWIHAPLPISAGANEVEVEGVSCGTTEYCVVLGEGNGSVFAWMTADGGAGWVSTPPPPTQQGFDGIACTSINFCIVASFEGLLVTTIGLGGFSTAQTPAVVSADSINAVSCVPDSQTCVAVGDPSECLTGGPCTPLIASSVGGSNWVVAKAIPTSSAYLANVSCVSGGECVVGGYVPATYQPGDNQVPAGSTLLLRSSGNLADWSTIAVPKVGTGSLDGLIGVSCATHSFCVAGGMTLGIEKPSSSPTYYDLIGEA
jgi:photosystem II stability/assembly factor-like uncharacterized protein